MFLSIVNTFMGSKCHRSQVSCTSVAFLLYKAQGLRPMVKSVEKFKLLCLSNEQLLLWELFIL